MDSDTITIKTPAERNKEAPPIGEDVKNEIKTKILS